MNQAVAFLTGMHLLRKDDVFFCKRPRTDTPWLIVAWIMNLCDSINLDGTQKPLSEERGTYGHAQKMRASMTYAFGRLQGLGNMWWHESDVGGGIMVGNPSISMEVSSFMCSLRQSQGDTLILTSLTYSTSADFFFFMSNYHPDIKPFHLWAFPPHEAHICPVRALAAWLSESRIESGYSFSENSLR
ncbi:hypothetical protein F4604DRAFT_2019487 [Suillus subluteus]|nr:hypothetical protein F4604DRAFT_2019487 [Suillus subluteus]